MLSVNNNGDIFAASHLLDFIRNLLNQSLLNLELMRMTMCDSSELAEPQYHLARDVGDMNCRAKREQVMFAKAMDFHPSHRNHLIRLA
jgi:hypothetical protein